jgi:hypothetical protein
MMAAGSFRKAAYSHHAALQHLYPKIPTKHYGKQGLGKYVVILNKYALSNRKSYIYFYRKKRK